MCASLPRQANTNLTAEGLAFCPAPPVVKVPPPEAASVTDVGGCALGGCPTDNLDSAVRLQIGGNKYLDLNGEPRVDTVVVAGEEVEFDVMSMTMLTAYLPPGVGTERMVSIKDQDGFISMSGLWEGMKGNAILAVPGLLARRAHPKMSRSNSPSL